MVDAQHESKIIMKEQKRIFLIPKGELTPQLIKVCEQNGMICIETDNPEKFKLLQTIPLLEGSSLLAKCMKTLQYHTDSGAAAFLLEIAKEIEKGLPTPTQENKG